MADVSSYRPLVAELAERALGMAANVQATANSVSLGLTPARMLLHDAGPAAHSDLVTGLKALATIGRANAHGGDDADPVLLDAAGHRRSVYHSLVLHLHLAAFERYYETMSPSAWSACEDALWDAILPAREVEAWTDAPPPVQRTNMVLWHCLCLLEQATLLGRDVDIEMLDGVVHHALSQPGTGKSLHAYDPDESPDAWTYRELTGLHALANLSLRRRNSTWAQRVQEVAMYHLEHTQPDYTTYEPWALFAFAWSPATAMFAEQQLHDTQTHLAGVTGEASMVTGLLLADAAANLARF